MKLLEKEIKDFMWDDLIQQRKIKKMCKTPWMNLQEKKAVLERSLNKLLSLKFRSKSKFSAPMGS